MLQKFMLFYTYLYAILSYWEKGGENYGMFCAWSHTKKFLTFFFQI